MFKISDIVLINKIDTLDYFEFDFDKAKERIHNLNPKALIFPISAKTGEGFDELVEYLKKAIISIK
jgi:hydrogenase nickel incorporation protein HypB